MVKDITNQDIFTLLQDFMQMTSERFDRLEGRMDSLEGRMDRLEKTSREHTAAILELTEQVERIETKLEGIDGLKHS